LGMARRTSEWTGVRQSGIAILTDMKRVRRKLTNEQRREIAAVARAKDEGIDLCEMPEVVDWSDAEVGRFYRPPNQ
jgi:hypothetical protein